MIHRQRLAPRRDAGRAGLGRESASNRRRPPRNARFGQNLHADVTFSFLSGKHMTTIAATDQSSTPVIDFEDADKRLHITDPFFAFYLRWGDMGGS
jgi:hypothetical protein